MPRLPEQRNLGQRDRWKQGWIDGRKNGMRTYGVKNGWKYVLMNGWMDGWVYGWVGRWTDGL